MHVDLMQRASGYRVCNPQAVSGEEIAARARSRYAGQGRDPSFTGSVEARRRTTLPKRQSALDDDKVGHQLPFAVPGEDGAD
jgi:hypothetical protein